MKTAILALIGLTFAAAVRAQDGERSSTATVVNDEPLTRAPRLLCSSANSAGRANAGALGTCFVNN